VVVALTAAIDELVETDPDALADSESIEALHRQLARLDAVASRAAARWDANRAWAADGARTGVAWLAATLRIPRPEANRRLRLGRALRSLPNAERAWLDGDITGAHVSALACARSTDILIRQMQEEEAELVAAAKRSKFRAFEQHLAYWRQLHDLDDEESRARRQAEGRRVHLSPGFKGTWILDGELDPIGGSIVHTTLMKIERELFEADWKAASEQLGREPIASELPRTAAQRRADALVEMATRARMAPANGRRPEPLFTVVIGHPRFEQLCELASGAVVTPGSIVPWFSEAWIERIVFGPASRVIDVGVRTRLFKGGTRRAVEVRDRNECFHDLCDEPAEQIDHVQPYEWGGPTVQDNGRGACAFHNRERHRRGPPRGQAA
jgi:hypothetical protein